MKLLENIYAISIKVSQKYKKTSTLEIRDMYKKENAYYLQKIRPATKICNQEQSTTLHT